MDSSFSNGVVTIGAGLDLQFALTPSGVFIQVGGSEFQPGHSWANIAVMMKMQN